ncbi:helix-turn-helix transcriptional regulator (plasmid) [Geminicoccaceae bacterium 1502E]|nr:helix-turn-helix transcriptional regulator [Geminicoccaceae bacterium 1502E]
MSIDYQQIGSRLRAYRLARGLTAEQVAQQLGLSRAAVFRLEKGSIVKLETFERIAGLLGVSIESLLGVGVEYHASAISFFERMRQLEEGAEQIMTHFEPVSYLLTSPDYGAHLRHMLAEAGNGACLEAAQEAVLAILDERRRTWQRRRPAVASLVGSIEIERFLRLGLIGTFDLPPEEAARRRHLAALEIETLCQVMEQEPVGIQIGLVEGAMPSLTFQIFRRPEGPVVAISPFRLGELANIDSGVAMITSTREAVELWTATFEQLWSRALKGAQAAAALRSLLRRVREEEAAAGRAACPAS